MCDPATSSGRRQTLPRPRWTLLYGVALLSLGAIATTELLAPAGLVRTVLEGALTLGAFIGAAGWVRSNRVPLELADWCDCVGEKTVIRVIASERRPPFDEIVLLKDFEEETSIAILR